MNGVVFVRKITLYTIERKQINVSSKNMFPTIEQTICSYIVIVWIKTPMFSVKKLHDIKTLTASALHQNRYPEGASSNPARVKIFQLTSAV